MAECILLITMDECRYDAIGCHGGMGVATPNMDRLAAEGTRFDRAYTPCPVCLPARCALLSGQYAHRSGMYGNATDRLLNPAAPNLFNLARTAGYRTAMIGKCHFTGTQYGRLTYGKPIDDPRIRAYLKSLGMDDLDLCDGKVVPFWYWDEYSEELRDAGLFDQVAFPGTPSYARVFSGPAEWHPDAWVGRKTVDRINSHAVDENLFVWSSFPGPHYPHDPPEEYLSRVDRSKLPLLRYREGEFDGGDKAQAGAFRREKDQPNTGCEGGGHPGGSSSLSDEEWAEIQAHYLANVAMIDDYIGEMVSAAERKFGTDLTVMLTTDHGDMMGAHRLWGKGMCAYEEVIRVPLLARGPAFEKGAVSHARVSSLDIFPTVCELAGAAIPQGTDGVSLKKWLADGGRELIFSSCEDLFIVDDGRFRLSINRKRGTTELYDLMNDPGEYDNLATDEQCMEDRARLERAALEHLMSVALDGSQPPVRCTNGYEDVLL